MWLFHGVPSAAFSQVPVLWLPSYPSSQLVFRVSTSTLRAVVSAPMVLTLALRFSALDANEFDGDAKKLLALVSAVQDTLRAAAERVAGGAAPSGEREAQTRFHDESSSRLYSSCKLSSHVMCLGPCF